MTEGKHLSSRKLFNIHLENGTRGEVHLLELSPAPSGSGMDASDELITQAMHDWPPRTVFTAVLYHTHFFIPQIILEQKTF